MDYRPGASIFDQDVQCILNPVNCQAHKLQDGWLKGLAGEFEQRYPAIMQPYRWACREGHMKPGRVQLLGLDRASGQRSKTPDFYIANVATKDRWTDASRLDWVNQGLESLAAKVGEKGIRSIAIPMLGAGLGKLSWADVQGRVEHHFEPLSRQGVQVIVLGTGRERAVPVSPDQAAGADPEDVQFYAGIGARKTPPSALKKMAELGEIMSRNGIWLRSGAAEGADSAFEEGCDRFDAARKQIFLGWNGFNGRRANGTTVLARDLKDGDPEVEVAKSYYGRSPRMPNGDIARWNRLGRGGKSLMARNTNQLMGPNVGKSKMTDLIICWTEHGEVVGGTGQAIRIAQDKGIPVLNLGDPMLKDLGAEALGGMALQMIAGVPLETALKEVRGKRPARVGAER